MTEEKLSFLREKLSEVEAQLRGQWCVLEPEVLAEKLYHTIVTNEDEIVDQHPYLILNTRRLEKRAGGELPLLRLFPGDILLATSGSGKIEVFKKIATKYKGKVEVRSLGETEERRFHDYFLPFFSRRGETSCYAPEISLSKVGHKARESWEEGKAIFATDIVVLGPKGEIIEKPVDLEEAGKELENLSGEKICASVGVDCVVPLQTSGTGINFLAGMYISMRLREISEREIRDYLDKLGEKTLGFAGGVDYSREGQGFLDPKEEIVIEGYGSLLNPAIQKIHIGLDRIDVLSTAFKGAPEFLIEALYRQAKIMQEYDIRTSWSRCLIEAEREFYEKRKIHCS